MDFHEIFAEVRPLIPTYAHLLVSAIFPIWAGSHASLQRPSSAEKPVKSSEDDDGEQQDEDEDQVQKMEGLTPTDALMFPVMAGCTLAGLYFLIKWLQDPALLNKILNGYFAVFGALSVAKLLADTFGFVENLVFPNVWARHGVVWKVKSKERKVVALSGGTSEKEVTTRLQPLPGLLSSIKLPQIVQATLWRIRELPQQKMTFLIYIEHVVSGKEHVGINGLLGSMIAIIAALYFNIVDKPWWLTNLFGFSFSYSALQLLSPTTFSTGALILSALFFYDIYFVFYTPMMVTVAKSLDVPIKLLFPRPPGPGETPEQVAKSHAMLGLGDVVLPGIMIGLALRFDLFMHYVRKQRQSPEDKSEDSKHITIKAPYAPISGRYGDAFWTQSWFGRSLLPPGPLSDQRTLQAALTKATEVSFPRPYFHASVVGYLLGLLVTLSVMHVWGHAQPALLYLVPGVLLSLLLTGAVRGELKAMGDYTELEEEPVAEAKSEPNTDDAKANRTSTGASTKEDDDAHRAVASETVKVGDHEEKAVIKFSVSRRVFHTQPESDEAQKVAPKTDQHRPDDEDDLRRSSRLKAVVDKDTPEDRPSKRSRMA